MLFAELSWPEATVCIAGIIAVVAVVYILVKWGPEL